MGWSALPDGALWYANEVRLHTTTRMTPEEIHAFGLAEVARFRAGMQGVMREVGFKGTLPEFFAYVQSEPGHHFQTSIAVELTGLPRFRRFEGNVAYDEGWALYAESLGRELGLFTDPMQWYGRLSDEMLRAMRLVVDTGIHARGWSREQAIAYMRENSSMADSDIEAEVERYIVNLGQTLGYKIGDLRIQALRRRAEQTLGSRFDVREFHTQVLDGGSLAMDILEAKVGRWIESQQAPGGY